MFFLKNKNTNDTPQSAQVSPSPSDQKPIYVIGESPAAYFLAARLQKNGENVYLVSTKIKKNLKEITLKEEYNLQKNKFNIRRLSLITARPKLIFIAPDAFHLKSVLSYISAAQTRLCPVIGINIIKDINLFQPILGKEFIPGYLTGCLNINNEELSAVGREPTLIIGKNEIDDPYRKKILRLLKPLALPIEIKDNETKAFWQYFSPYSLAALNSLLSDGDPKHAAMTANDKTLFSQAVSEISSLSKISVEEINKTLSGIPADFIFKIKKDTAKGYYSELNTIHEQLTQKANETKTKIPALNDILKQCYDRTK